MKTENLYTPNKIRTFTGKYIDVSNPQPEDICIEDIAHSLSMMPRFAGHLPVNFTVAQHSLNCYNRAHKELRLAALLHDASEAYILDMPKPIKNMLPDYQKMENHLMDVISIKFGFKYPIDPMIKHIDKSMLEYEWNDIMIHPEWRPYIMPQSLAETEFLYAFSKANSERK